MFDALMWRRRLAEARTLLEAERRLLRRGSIRELSRLAPRRAAMAARLEEMPKDAVAAHAGALEEIRRLARRNGRLLKALLDGAADARKRLEAIAAARAELGVYARDGGRVASAAPRRERRL